MKQQGLITAYKHFLAMAALPPTRILDLPRVDRTREEAFAIDIAPYKQAIDRRSGAGHGHDCAYSVPRAGLPEDTRSGENHGAGHHVA